ncbi:hypothetical protein [Schinkia azotoformans]|uniref:hypothetical protein n=1 Tax=Schinkia azotoformans TaxID=1454 RepID=UPI002DBE1109|nr:hypothetical protein [Schinkia azotoformans]MEC1768311.1 hypothetical protein [Schinkia azotoformans]
MAAVETKILFLVDLKSKTFKKLNSRLNTNEDEMDALIPYCKMLEDKLKEGWWLFTADLSEDGEYEATYRATYSEWMLEDEEYDSEYPYYIDCAESEERVYFYDIVNK